MELFVVEGSLEEISTFVGKIRATQDTLSVDYSVIPVDDFGAVFDVDDHEHDHGDHGDADAADAEPAEATGDE
jgi:CopG family nickel-responsive transcriptional regulator